MNVPEFQIQIVTYRPVNIYIAGEIKNPGKYTISGINDQSFYYQNNINQSQSKIIDLSNRQINKLS